MIDCPDLRTRILAAISSIPCDRCRQRPDYKPSDCETHACRRMYEQEADAVMMVLPQSQGLPLEEQAGANIDEILLLRTEVQRLEKEADWLAERIGKMDECRFAFMGQFSPCDLRCQNDCRAAWREAARKAVEPKNDGGWA